MAFKGISAVGRVSVFIAAVEFVGKDVCQRLLTERPVAENGLGGAEPAQLIDDVGQGIFT